MELKLKTLQNFRVLQEEQENGKAVIICTAGGQPIPLVKCAENPNQILVPVRKGRIVMIAEVTDDGDSIYVYRICSTYQQQGEYYARTEVLNSYVKGAWAHQLPASFKPAEEILRQKLHSSKQIVFAAQPIFIPVRQSQKGYDVLDEECGSERSTIICRPDQKPAKAVYFYQKPRGDAGKQAVVEIGPRYRILRGGRTESGYVIDIYMVDRMCCLAGQRLAEVHLLNKCVDGIWQHGLPIQLRPLIISLIDKIEENDTETVVSRM